MILSLFASTQILVQLFSFVITNPQMYSTKPLSPGAILRPHAGFSKPVGEQAVGWRVAVYWRADLDFHHATIKSFDPATGQYCLAYARGEREHLHLAKQCLKWCPAPKGSKYSQVKPLGSCRGWFKALTRGPGSLKLGAW